MNYVKWVRQQPCCKCGRPGPSHAHHPTFGRGMGQKSSDDTVIPFCGVCHDNFHSATGQFRSSTKEQRRAFQEAQVQKYQLLFKAGDCF